MITQEQLIKQHRNEELKDISEVASSKSGRRLLWRIFAESRVFSTTFNTDASVAAFKEGQRNLGLMILNDLMIAAPEKFITMQRGAKEREQAYERLATEQPDGSDEF